MTQINYSESEIKAINDAISLFAELAIDTLNNGEIPEAGLQELNRYPREIVDHISVVLHQLEETVK